MCRTIQTSYLLCLHQTTTTDSCRTLFATLFLRCKPTTSKIFMSDFCPRCRAFWDRHGISESSRRARVSEYRASEGYDGPLSPSAVPAHGSSSSGEEGLRFFGFVQDGGVEWRRNPDRIREEGEESRNARRGDRIAPIYIRELDAKWGKGPRPSASLVKRRSCDSTASRVTIWPGPNASRKNSIKLGPDEFGHDSDVESDWSRGEGVIKAEEFDLDVMERGQRDQKLKPVAPMPASTIKRPE